MAVIVPAIAGKVIHIGRAGENLATTVQFDVADWLKPVAEGGFGNNGTFSLFVQQGGGQIYPQTLPNDGLANALEDSIVSWNVTNSNTATIGLGKCELVYSIQEVKVKSVIYDIVVTNSLDIEAQGNIPSAIDSWLNEVAEAAERISGAAEQADIAERYAKGTSNGTSVTNGIGYHDNAKYYSQRAAQWATGGTSGTPSSTNNAKYYSDKVGNMTTTTTTSGEGTNASVNITTVDNHYNLAFTIPRGNTGETGATGATGAAAGFGTPTATIDNSLGSTGTPGVSVTASGSATSKIFAFKFGNLKGDKGDQGVGFAGILTSLPTVNSSNYNTYKDKIWIYNGHAYSVNNSYNWVDGGQIKTTFIYNNEEEKVKLQYNSTTQALDFIFT